jgi:hypothetical protein
MTLKNLLPVLMSLAVFELSAQIQISENSTSRYSFSWDLENYEIETQSSEQHSEIFFSGSNTVLGEDGEAVLPGYSMLLGVPPEGEIRVNFNSESVKTVSLERTLLKHKNLTEKRQPQVKFNNPWICEPVYSTLQGMRTAYLIIRPFIYDEKTNTVKVLQKASCTIEFPSSPASRHFSASFSDRKPILSNVVDNFPVAARWYAERKLSKVTQSTFPIVPGQKIYRFRIGDGCTGFNEMTTDENGILLIPGDTIIRNFGIQKTDAVVLYASHKGELPNGMLNPADIPSGLVEVPLLRIDKNRNTFVDSDDYFLAFVTGASDWTFDTNGKFRFNLDRYDDYRKYWLTVTSGSSAATVKPMTKSTVLADTISTVGNQIMFYNSEGTQQLSGNEGGLSWCWYEKITSARNFAFRMTLPGLDTSQGGSISVSPGSYSLQVSLGKPLVMDMHEYVVENWGNLVLNISTTNNDTLELQNIRVNYMRKLVIGDAGKLEIFSPDDSLFYTYRLQVTTNDLLYIFRISNDEKDVSLVDTIRNFANRFFTWTDTGGKGIRYMVCSEKALTLLPQRSTVSEKIRSDFLVENLRATSDSTDYLIISAPEFIPEAQRLAAHKKKMGFNAPRIVNVKDVYDAFAGGDIDPVSIRNFIAYVQNYWKNSQYLSYVLLFGGGHYDYKGKEMPRKSIFIPVYYDGFNLREDYFTLYNGISQAAVGRITCSSKEEAANVVDKIITMEDPEKADYSDWRNRALLVADDDRQGSTPDGIGHHKSSDSAASKIEINHPSIIINKVYLFDYKWNSAGQKPEASKAIINEINNGVGYVNYFGHGGADQWAQEKILQNVDVDKLINKNRYPLISSFSCSVGRFDMPNSDCLSSLLLTGKYGSIISLSSTRTAYALSNEKLAMNFYSILFNQDTVNSVGMAFYKAKIRSSSSASSSYAIFGDPSIVIMTPTNSIQMEITNKAGKKIDTLMALQQITVTGAVVNKNGNIVSSFGSSEPAFIHLGLFNPPEETGRNDGGEDVSIRYIKPGRTIFMGRTQIHNGKFQQTIQLPGNLSFGKDGVKLTGYAWREGKNGAATGCKSNIIFSGTDSSMSANDSVGPQITLRPVHDYPEMSTAKMSFSDHIISMDSLKCEIEVYDPSGVDIIGNGPDEGLNMEIEGVLGQQNINHKFRFNEGDYRKGTALLREYVLKPGIYTLNFSARDLNGNLSKASFKVRITQPQEFELDRVFNSPNPFRMGRGTKFYFFPTQTSYKTFVSIKIYTLSGKPVCVIKNAVNGQFWDGRDQTGTLLSPDIYLYQIVGSAPDQKKQVKSKIMKLVINP